jgi:hypothetical protein
MACVNKTRPYYVNQMGKTQSKAFGERHGMCESALRRRSSREGWPPGVRAGVEYLWVVTVTTRMSLGGGDPNARRVVRIGRGQVQRTVAKFEVLVQSVEEVTLSSHFVTDSVFGENWNLQTRVFLGAKLRKSISE